MVKAAAALFVLLLYQCSCAWSPTFLRWRLSLLIHPQQQRRSVRRFQSATDNEGGGESSVDEKEQERLHKRLEARFRAAVRGQRLPPNPLAQSTSLQNLYYRKIDDDPVNPPQLSAQASSKQNTMPFVPTVADWKDDDSSKSLFRMVIWPNSTSLSDNSQRRWSPLQDTKFEWGAPLMKIVDSLNPWRKKPEETGPKKRFSMKFSPQRTANQQNPMLYLEDGYWQVKTPPRPPKDAPSFEKLMTPMNDTDSSIVEDRRASIQDNPNFAGETESIGDDEVGFESLYPKSQQRRIRNTQDSADDSTYEQSSALSRKTDTLRSKKVVIPTTQKSVPSSKKATIITKKLSVMAAKKIVASSPKKISMPLTNKAITSPVKRSGIASDTNAFVPSAKKKAMPLSKKAAFQSDRTALPTSKKAAFPSAKKVGMLSKKGSVEGFVKKNSFKSATSQVTLPSKAFASSFKKSGLPIKKKASVLPISRKRINMSNQTSFAPPTKEPVESMGDTKTNEQSTAGCEASSFLNSTYSKPIRRNETVISVQEELYAEDGPILGTNTDLYQEDSEELELKSLSTPFITEEYDDDDPIIDALFALPPPENRTTSDSVWGSHDFGKTEKEDLDSDLEALKSSLEGVIEEFSAIISELDENANLKESIYQNSSLEVMSDNGEAVVDRAEPVYSTKRESSAPAVIESHPTMPTSAKKQISVAAKSPGLRRSPFQKQSTFLPSSAPSMSGSKFSDTRPTIPSTAQYDSTDQNTASLKVGKVKKNLALGIKHSPVHAAAIENDVKGEKNTHVSSESGPTGVPKLKAKKLLVAKKQSKQWGITPKKIGEITRAAVKTTEISVPQQQDLESFKEEASFGEDAKESLANSGQVVDDVMKQRFGAGPKVLTSNGIIAPVSDLSEQQADLVVNEKPQLMEQRIRIQPASQQSSPQTRKMPAASSFARRVDSREGTPRSFSMSKKKKELKVSVVSMEKTFVTTMETLQTIKNGSQQMPKVNGFVRKGKASVNGRSIPVEKAPLKKKVNLGPSDGSFKLAQKNSKGHPSKSFKLKKLVKKVSTQAAPAGREKQMDTEGFERLQNQLSSVRASTTSEVIKRSSPIAPPSMRQQGEGESQRPKGEVYISPQKKDKGWGPASSLSLLQQKLGDRPPSKDESRSKNVGVALSSMMEKRNGRRETVHQIAESDSKTPSSASTSPYSNYDWEKAQRASRRSSDISDAPETTSPYNNYDWDELKNRKPQKVTIISDDAEGQLPAPVVPPSMRPTFQQSLPDYITGEGDSPPPTMPPSSRQAEVNFGSQSPAPTMRPTFQQSIPEFYAGGPPTFQTDPGIRGSLPPSFQASLPSAEHVIKNEAERGEAATGMPDFVTGGSPDPTGSPSFQSSLPEHVTGGGSQGAAPTMPPTGGRLGLPPSFPPFQSSVPERVSGGRELNYQSPGMPEQQQLQSQQEQPIIGSGGGGRQGPSPTMPPFQSSIPERVTGGRELNFQTPVPQADQQGDDFVPSPAPPSGPPSFQASLPGAVTGLKQGVRESASQNQMTHQEILLTQISSETRAGRVDQAENIWGDYVAQYPSAATFLGYSRWVENELGDVNKARSILQETMISKLDEEEYRATWVLRQWATFEKRQGLFERAQLVERGDIEGLLAVKIEEQQEEDESREDEQLLIEGGEDESRMDDSSYEQDWSESEAYYDDSDSESEAYYDDSDASFQNAESMSETDWEEREESAVNQEWSETQDWSDSDEGQWPAEEVQWPAEDNDDTSYY